MKSGHRAILLGLVLTLAAAPAAWSALEPRVMLLLAKEQLADRDFVRARGTLEKLLASRPGTVIVEEAELLAARSEHLGGRDGAAVQRLQRFLKEHRGARSERRARHLLADVYCALRRFKEASRITREHLDFLAGDLYRQKLGGLYLALAEEAWRGREVEGAVPGRRRRVRDHQRAAGFYRQALDIGVPEAEEIALRFRLAECDTALGGHGRAAAGYQEILKETKDNAARARASFLRGEALLRSGARDAARELLRAVEDQWKGYAARAAALQGDSYQALRSGSKSARSLAAAHWRRALRCSPELALALELRSKLGGLLAASGRNAEAIEEYEASLKLQGAGNEAGEIRFRIASALEGMGRFADSRAAFGAFLSRHPSHPRFPEVQQRIAQSWIREGAFLARDKTQKSSAEAAVKVWRRFLERYPVHPQAAAVQRGIGELWAARGRWDEAIAAWRLVARKYRGRAVGALALESIAKALEHEKKDLSAAIGAREELVRHFGQFGPASRSRRVLRVMRERSLSLVTQRSFHTGQRPTIRISSRNVPILRLRINRLDMLEYFRKKGRVDGVEQLAVGLVKPQKSWEQKVPKYEPYRLLTSSVEIPVKGEGAWVVTAETDEFVATTLVLVTDLVSVVKKSPEGLFVFVKDRRSGEPAKGVRVLALQGTEQKLDAKTGADGVLQAKLSARNLRVLCVRGKSVAYAASREGLRQSFGYQPKGYVYTDRPVYRPGQKVRYRAILRRVSGGLYEVPRGVPVVVTVRNASGVSIVRKKLRCSRFGTVSGELALDSEAPIGAYSIEVELDRRKFSGSFHVEEYRKPSVLVELSTEQDSVLTGEGVKATLRARRYYGGAVSDAEVRWLVTRTDRPFDASAHKSNAWFYEASRGARPKAYPEVLARGQGKTNAAGELEISFKTKAIDRDSAYSIVAHVRGMDRRWVSGAGGLLCTQRGYTALLEAERKVVRPGQALRIGVETVAASHAGRAAKGELRVLRLNSIGNPGERSEALVATHLVSTRADGKQSLSLKLPRPGDYEIRYVGKDRRGSLVEGRVLIACSGEAEDLAKQAKLRADKEVYKRGETARVLLNSPVADTWALLTFEGERVLDHRVIRLRSRSTVLDLKLKDEYAPNVFLKLAIVTEDGLFEGEDEVLVFKYLQVAVRPLKSIAAPGEEVDVEILTTDQSGRPVSAEVSVGVVDEKVYALRAESVGGLKPFFYDKRRRNAVGTRSSVSWRDAGHTKRQVKELIAEKAAAELATKTKELQERVRRQGGLALGRKLDALKSNSRAGGRGYFGKKRKSKGSKGWASPKPSMAPRAPAEAPMLEEEKSADGDDAASGGESSGLQAASRVRRRFADTTHWSPSVVTGADGKARVRVHLADDLTLWRATVRGVSSGSLVGDGRARMVTTQKVVAALSAPRFLVSGDRARLEVVSHNRSGVKVKAALSAGAKGLSIDARALSEGFELAPNERRRLALPAVAPKGSQRAVVKAELRTSAGGDALEREIFIRPYGLPVSEGQSGVIDGEALVELSLPADRIPGTSALELRLLPSTEASLVEGLRSLESYPYGCVEQTVSRFLPLVFARSALLKLGSSEAALGARIESGIALGVQRLFNLQRSDGGWGWWKRDASAPETTAYALLGLEIARTIGAHVDGQALERGRRAAANLLRRVGSQLDQRAVLIYALSYSRRVPFDDVNRLLRDLDRVSTQGLAQLALAARRLGKDQSRIVALIKSRIGAAGSWKGGSSGWFSSRVEGTAWAALALLELEPASPLPSRAADWLLGQRSGGLWGSTKETAACVLFLGRLCQKRRLRRAEGRLSVEINGKLAATTKFDGRSLKDATVIRFGEGDLKIGKNRVRLRHKGVGKLRYSLQIRCVAERKMTARASKSLRLKRRYLRDFGASPSAAKPGWSIVRPRFRPKGVDGVSLSSCLSGDRLWVELEIRAGEALSYVLVEDALPAGFEALREGAEGGFDRFEARADRAAFFITRLPRGTRRLRYRVQAVTPGLFHALPCQAGPMYEPEIRATSAAVTMTVRDDEGGAKRAPTPDEELAAALKLAKVGEHKKAIALLKSIAKRFKLTGTAKGRIQHALLLSAFAIRDASLAVSAYELLIDMDRRWRRRLSLTQRRALVVAYDVVGESHRAHLLGRELLMEHFREAAKVAEVYRSLGRPLPAQDYLSRLLMDYPETPSIIGEWYALARRYYQIPRSALKPGAPKLPLYDRAYRDLKDFCARFPGSPLADDSQLEAAKALSLMGDHKGADREAAFILRRYKGSRMRESALRLQLKSRFALERWDGVLAVGKELLALRHKSGRRWIPSPYVHEVHYSLAKVHHIRGELAAAVASYAKARRQVADADDAWRYLTEKGLELPELVRVKPEETARLKLRFKNLERLSLRVYAVDFMTLFLTRKSLRNAHKVDLTGIDPVHEETLRLATGPSYRTLDREIVLPVKAPGVYLVVCKSGAFDKSVLVSVSELSLRLQRRGPRLRVYLKRGDRPAEGARVRIASGGRLVASGKTDARGVFEAPVPQNNTAVVVEKDGHYALGRE